MALVLLDRARETTIVVGTTASAILLGAAPGYQSLVGVGNGNTTYYCISDQGGANWEVGIGTYTASGTTLARTTVLASSNAGALVVFTAGTKDVFCTYPAEKSVHLDASGNAIGLGAATGTSLVATGAITAAELLASNGLVLNNKTVSTSYTIPTGYNATATGPMTVASGAVVTIPSGSRWMIL